jgi:uncharacterized protein with PQ loop repeat
MKSRVNQPRGHIADTTPMPPWFITALTVFAFAVNVLLVWPQAIKMVRTRSVAGVSPGTWTISVLLFSVWIVYSVSIGYWGLAAANLSCLIGAIVILTVGTREGWNRWWAWLSACGFLVATALVFTIPLMLPILMVSVGVALRVPQLVTLMRSSDLSGFSVTTWILAISNAAVWMVVSIDKHATAVVIANIASITTTIILLTVYAYRRRVLRLIVPA